MPRLESFIEVPSGSDFSIHNLPYGIFSTPDTAPRAGVAIGEYIVDLSVLEQVGLLPIKDTPVFNQSTLNEFIAQGPIHWQAVRAAVQNLLIAENPRLREDAALRAQVLVPQNQAQMHLPVEIRGYTDFYSSKEHAFNVGCMFRGADNALMPNWSELPVAYNGRASSVVISGTDIVRPSGQIMPTGATRPVFGPSQKLDFELEMGFIVGRKTSLSEPVPVEIAADYVFGMVLLNDWSARDLQQWEYVPLGPFNGKSFGTSISPWIVPMAALAPFQCPAVTQEPKPLAYLQEPQRHTYDIQLQAAFVVEGQETVVCESNFKYLYWSMAQQLAHHTVSGCNLQVGDLMGTGTISGPTPQSRGSLLELNWNMSQAVHLSGGETRYFINDGDTIVMRGFCEKEGIRVGFGEVRGTVQAALDFPTLAAL